MKWPENLPDAPIELQTAGNTVPMLVDSYSSRCGGIRGIGVRLGHHAGGFVISLDDLSELVDRAKTWHSSHPELLAWPPKSP